MEDRVKNTEKDVFEEAWRVQLEGRVGDFAATTNTLRPIRIAVRKESLRGVESIKSR